MSNIVNGNTLMLFIKEGNNYKAIAFAKTHELSIDSDKREVHSRLHDEWTDFILESGSWDISCESLYTEESDKLFDMFNSRNSLVCMFGIASNYRQDGIVDTNDSWAIANGYKGKACIRQLEITASHGEATTMKIKLEGVSPIKKANIDDEDDFTEPSVPPLAEPIFQFTVSQDTAPQSQDGEYKISDFTDFENPNDLPTRFVIDRFDGRIN